MFIVRFRNRHCCVSVIMRPSGHFISPHLALGAIWVWDPALEGALVAKNTFYWQQCFFFTHVSLHILLTRGGQTCSKVKTPASRKNILLVSKSASGNLFTITGRINNLIYSKNSTFILLWRINGALDILSKYLFVMELRFDAILYSKLRNENSNSGRSKFHAGRIWPADRRLPTPGLDKYGKEWKFYRKWCIVLLRSEIPSGICAKLRTVAASNNRVHMPWSLYYCLFAPHICMVLFFTHIPFVVNHTISATSPERLQQYMSILSFCLIF